jgi:rhodanese-related sulfurtransferase
MAVKRVSPAEARELLDKDGYVYVDVRSIPEYEAGHPPGAYNVPLQHLRPAGMAPNPDFLAVMEACFPRDARLVLGCKAGGRSLAAAGLLQQRGYLNVVDQRAGFHGTPGEAGWQGQGLPVTNDSGPDRRYESLLARSR